MNVDENASECVGIFCISASSSGAEGVFVIAPSEDRSALRIHLGDIDSAREWALNNSRIHHRLYRRGVRYIAMLVIGVISVVRFPIWLGRKCISDVRRSVSSVRHKRAMEKYNLPQRN